MPRLSLTSRLNRAGINPEAAAMAALFSVTIGLSAIAITAQDRRLIQACQTTGENVTVCTLKVSGR